ncbi:MAG TPA: undecaprenyl/decaprenyl-phosphate alpha-N-acetylglucosaminyl 1-phosphate transferase [Saprospirales bacterium]|nr:undecaprenyl/decaprenyl-phosphate alpha-N-acetylglucosaminyl 1-phosphate transferase [Saprospirales bacterium]
MFDIVLSFITSFLLTYLAIPSIIQISAKKALFSEPDHRTSHFHQVPALGGVAIFTGVLFSIIMWTPFKYFGDLQYILCAFIILFMIGVKDDIDPVSPGLKFIAQLIAAFILVFKAQIRITTLYSIFGVGDLPYWLSIVLSVAIIVFIINSFNLIDGINGLAGMISIISSFVFGFWFYLVGRMELTVIAISLIGALLPFLKFNFSPAKLFMGDTGSLLIGLTASILAIQFVEYNKMLIDSEYYVSSAPAIAIAILIIPVYDTIRVFFLRLIKGHSPFRADKKHIHHLFLEVGFSHMQTTFVLSAINILFIIFAFKFNHLGSLILFLITFGMALIIFGFLRFLPKKLHLDQTNAKN